MQVFSPALSQVPLTVVRQYSFTAVSTKVVEKRRKRVREKCRKVVWEMPNKIIHIAGHLKSSLYGRGIMDSELLLKFIGYFPDCL